MRARSLMRGVAAAVVALALAPAMAAAGQNGGTIASVSGDAFVARDGRLLRAVPRMRLAMGDRVVTQANGSARIRTSDGCRIVVGASTSTLVGSCADTRTTGFVRDGAAGSGGVSGGTIAIGVAAAAAVVLGIVVAANPGDSVPNSP